MTSNNPPAAAYSVPSVVRWGVGDVGLAIGALVLTIVVGAVLAPVATDATRFAVSLGGNLLIVLVVLNATYRKGQRSLRADFALSFRPVDLLIGLGVGIGMRVVSTASVVLAVSVTGHTPTTGNLSLSPHVLWIVLNGFLVTALIAPFVEELFLRGLALQSIRNIVLRWRNREQPAEPAQQRRAMWISVVLSSLLFALLHSGQSADGVVVFALGVSTFLLGFVNALLVFRTGRLGPAIVAHVVFNGSAVALSLFA